MLNNNNDNKSFGKEIEFVQVPVGQEVKVDLLIGLDTYWKLITPEIICLSKGLAAQRSVFGWVLSGPVPVPASEANHVSHQLFCLNVSETHLKNFWDLESIGIHDSEAPTPDPVLCEFYNKVQFSDDRYVEV